MDGDTKGWLEIDAATGEIKTKQKLDRESLESLEITVTAFEKGETGDFRVLNWVSFVDQATWGFKVFLAYSGFSNFLTAKAAFLAFKTCK